MNNNIKLIIFSSIFFSASCCQFDEYFIPGVSFSSSMQHEFREKLQQQKLLIFDDLSDFSPNFIGTLVTQKSLDRAMSQAFEKFGLAYRTDFERNRKKFELKDIEKITKQEAKIKNLLVQVVRKNH